MGPPEFTGGNSRSSPPAPQGTRCFNGAAGIHRRKPCIRRCGSARFGFCFNGAAGIHRRKPAPGARRLSEGFRASMGPPEFTGGNLLLAGRIDPREARFNGAAGIHRRKHGSDVSGKSAATACFNGAAGIHRRKLGGRAGGVSPCGVLQWGRRNSPAETRSNRCSLRSACSMLQWGRRNSPAETVGKSIAMLQANGRFNGAAGIHRRKQLLVLRQRLHEPMASMGPPEFTGGNNENLQKRISNMESASMGPPEFTGGNWRPAPCWASATFLLQWGRRNSPAETLRAPQPNTLRRVASMGPPEFTGGNGQPIAIPWTRIGCFNGAAGIHRRKHAFGGAWFSVAASASMGPPEFTGGNEAYERGHVYRVVPSFNGAAGIHRRKLWRSAGRAASPASCFNGAAGIHRRKHQGGYAPFGGRGLLQWGRRNSPAETWGMGGERERRAPKLQWGRRNSPAETWGMGGERERRAPKLQWGRRNSPAETSAMPPAVGDGRPLQWGRRNSPAETGSPPADQERLPLRFNGAAGIHRRKRDKVLHYGTPLPPLQWGRRNSPAETVAPAAASVDQAPASMGPPEFTGGNITRMPATAQAFLTLQWGRRNSPAEARGISGQRIQA